MEIFISRNYGKVIKSKFDSATLEHLFEIGRKVLAEQDIDRLLSTAMDGAIEISGAERGIIILFDAQAKFAHESESAHGTSEIRVPGKYSGIRKHHPARGDFDQPGVRRA